MECRIGLGLLCTALLVGCGRAPENAESVAKAEESYAWGARIVDAIDIETLNGNIRVVPARDDSIRLDVERKVRAPSATLAESGLERVRVESELTDRTLSIASITPVMDEREFIVNLTLHAPGSIPLDLESNNGNISVTEHAADISASTTNGNIHCVLASLDLDGMLDLRTTNGNIDAALPADLPASFTVSTANGNAAVSGFAADVSYSVDERNRKRGTIGPGEAMVTLKSTNGNVSLKGR
ncbi:MAG: hypothetical protein MAG453_01135 [Calditrichaeota bacterium]|nr:hypothetical protein [Calditrichota bacterium]